MPLRILSWNVNGLRAAYKKGFIGWLKKEQPDIVCVQETKAALDQLPEDVVNVDGYSFYIASAQRKGYSGTAIWCKDTPIKVRTSLGIRRFDIEGRLIQLDYKKFILFNVYFPNGNASPERLDYKMDFYDAFLTHIDKLKNKGKNIIFCGDVNTAHTEIDLSRPKENEKTSGFLPQERAWIDKLISHGYLDTLRMFNKNPQQYTWWDLKTGARARNVGWRLDYFFVSKSLQNKVKSAFILSKVMGSDHCPIGIDLTP